jgi:hypothetical protein
MFQWQSNILKIDYKLVAISYIFSCSPSKQLLPKQN